MFGKPYEELTPEEKVRYDKLKEKNRAFDEWFVSDERQTVVDCLRTITEEVYVANSIYPTYMEELIERRLHQDKARSNMDILFNQLKEVTKCSTQSPLLTEEI